MNENELLQKVGFTNKEASIYTALLKQGSLSYNQLAETTKINRTTCYSVVKSLMANGLVTEDLGSPVVRIVPRQPTGLLDRLNQDQISLNKKIELTKRAVQELAKLIPGKRTTEPRLTYIEEQEILDFLFKRTEKWNTSVLKYDSTLWGFESAQFELDYKDYIKWFWNEPSSQTLQVKLFSDDASLRNSGVNPKDKVDFRYLPEIDFTTNIWVYGDYIILLSLEEHPYYLLEMKEPLFARNFREYFKAIWKAHSTLSKLGK